MVVSVLLKIKLGHAQINVLKIGITMSKTGSINPCLEKLFITPHDSWLKQK